MGDISQLHFLSSGPLQATAMRDSAFLFFLILCISVLNGGSTTSREPMVGGYSKITDLKDPHIVKIGKFAVSEINKATAGKLKFVRVANGKQQVVAGMNYDLVLEVADGDAKRRYEAEVYERAWENYISLTSYKRLK